MHKYIGVVVGGVLVVSGVGIALMNSASSLYSGVGLVAALHDYTQYTGDTPGPHQNQRTGELLCDTFSNPEDPQGCADAYQDYADNTGTEWIITCKWVKFKPPYPYPDTGRRGRCDTVKVKKDKYTGPTPTPKPPTPSAPPPPPTCLNATSDDALVCSSLLDKTRCATRPAICAWSPWKNPDPSHVPPYTPPPFGGTCVVKPSVPPVTPPNPADPCLYRTTQSKCTAQPNPIPGNPNWTCAWKDPHPNPYACKCIGTPSSPSPSPSTSVTPSTNVSPSVTVTPSPKISPSPVVTPVLGSLKTTMSVKTPSGVVNQPGPANVNEGDVYTVEWATTFNGAPVLFTGAGEYCSLKKDGQPSSNVINYVRPTADNLPEPAFNAGDNHVYAIHCEIYNTRSDATITVHVNAKPTPSPSPRVSPTPTVTPSPRLTPSLTPNPITPAPSPRLTPSPTPSTITPTPTPYSTFSSTPTGTPFGMSNQRVEASGILSDIADWFLSLFR